MSRPDKRADVMKAALEIIAERGFHDSPTSLIAERAQVGMGTIYRYFKSKDELIHTIFRERIAIAKENILLNYDRSQSLQDRFLFLSKNLFDYMLENPLDFRFYEQYSNSPFGVQTQLENAASFEQGITPGDYPFMTVFREGQNQGAIKAMSLPLLVALTLSPIFNLIGQALNGAYQPKPSECDAFFLACWDAIKA
ncbi:MAG: TetR/AcrR family transcriptional regulator [Deltaproteobacteria bacterium]|nr:TetR/AcrR family transcriptional regulator [Deltaproteobacteria bacterium]